MKPFQFLMILNPTEDEAKAGSQPKIVVEIKTILAADQNQAAMLAGREIPEQYMDKLARLEVVLRPF